MLRPMPEPSPVEKHPGFVFAGRALLWIAVMAVGVVTLAPIVRFALVEIGDQSLAQANDTTVRQKLLQPLPKYAPADYFETIGELAMDVKPAQPEVALRAMKRAVAVDPSRAFAWANIAWLETAPTGHVTPEAEQAPDDTPTDVLSADEQQRVDESVERALEWMVTQQQEDGSFLTLQRGQPGVTCLSVMAFMAHGHLPGAGPYGARLEKATDYVLGCQKQNGLICAVTPDIPQLSRQVGGLGTNTAYNHAIAALLLSWPRTSRTNARSNRSPRACST